MWFLAVITQGIGHPGNPFDTGRHVCIERTVTNRIRVIGANGTTAILTMPEACRRLRRVRKNGRPVIVRNQSIRWQQLREGRAFRDLRTSKLAA